MTLVDIFIITLVATAAGGLIVASVIATCRGPIRSGLKRGQEAARATRVRRACQRGEHDWRFIVGSVATGEMDYMCHACGEAKTEQIDI